MYESLSGEWSDERSERCCRLIEDGRMKLERFDEEELSQWDEEKAAVVVGVVGVVGVGVVVVVGGGGLAELRRSDL
ncbi:hypothetical protein TWF694_008720 [Orbilia ellipsospora]|uniref:Uncharacterized protein n=1 Tax=Orbilia ellipsospora TaxID=2528407 RepID=A0AAV9XJ84_9PEZI